MARHTAGFKGYFQDFNLKVIRLKYFIMVVGALILEIATLIIYLLNNEKIIEFDLFSASVLYGATSIIIVVLAIGVLVLIKVDRSRNRKKIDLLLNFKKSYQDIKSKYVGDISRFTRGFDTENAEIDVKINYAIVLEDIYSTLLKEFSSLKVPGFLKYAHSFESEYLQKEKQFYKSFSLFTKKAELEKYCKESSLAHRNYLQELNKLEKSLKLII